MALARWDGGRCEEQGAGVIVVFDDEAIGRHGDVRKRAAVRVEAVRLDLAVVPLERARRHRATVCGARVEAVRRADATDGLVPLHKLSQWLTYSLVEPLEAAGIQITDLDALTAVAEYRNGGLLIDLEVLERWYPPAAVAGDAAVAEVDAEGG